MSNPNSWQPPAGDQQPPAPPRYGEYAPPSAFPPPPGPQQGWTAPPKPGLIPLRPLPFGTILGSSFQVMRRNPKPTFGISLVLNAIIYLLTFLVIGAFVAFAIGRVFSATEADQEAIIAGSLLGGGLALLIPIAASVVLTAILQGVISLEVSRATVGEKLTTKQLLRLARGRIGALIGWAFALAGVALVALILATVVVTLLIALGGTAGLVIGILLAIGFVLVFIAAYAWIGTKVSLVPSALLIERATLRGAIARSWTLTNQSFWKTLGIEWLVALMVSTAAQVVTFPISLIFSLLAAALAPTGDETVAVVVQVIGTIITGLVGVVIGAIGVVMQSAAASLIYIDLRMRKEGLDLDLMRFVEARQAGDSSVADPFLTVPAPATPAAPPGSPWG